MSASALQQLAHKDVARPNATSKMATRKTNPARLETRPPPLLPARKDRLQFYGFYINEDRLMEYASSHCGKKLNIWSTMVWFLFHVRAIAQYENIDFQVVYGDEDPPSDATVREGSTGTPYFMIFSLCAWEVEGWPSRPTLEEIKRISDIIGTEPRWFTDIKSPEDYGNEN
ncbi:hypothetical protein GALMADRAFT_208756 [Galerina marginata CBS 339.88]|uniref:Thioredoxin-like fold domain-containing protein n=1 Tax=Galerina marginata (strain CBS 339.88) TaxID=685588 RepID=A0A067T8A3_GALM3|nr:hypothetical protein GALMADRAFT_208756 [Galerina marginata CBS 339.88]